MPIYAYQCQSCGIEKEVLQKLSDKPLVDCPACGNPSMKKMVTAAAFKLKGSGWYETDFKNSGKPKSESADKSNSSGTKSDSGSTPAATKNSAD